jgi:hypothetical protein
MEILARFRILNEVRQRATIEKGAADLPRKTSNKLFTMYSRIVSKPICG